MDDVTKEFLKSRASLLPEDSTAREILSAWVDADGIDDGDRTKLAFELLMVHSWDLDQLRAVLRHAL